MSRMIDDEEELKDYELIEKCSNLVTDENKCLDTWDDENADYKECKRINCHKKQLKRLEAENEKLKRRNKLYKKIIKENIEKANNNFMILTACIQGNLSIDEVKEYAKLKAKNDELKRKLKDLINYYELREGGMLEDIQYWKNKAQEFYRELEECKKSAVRELKATDKIEFKQYYKAENERLKVENEKLKQENQAIRRALKDKNIVAVCEENEKLKEALEEIKDRLIVVIEEEPQSTINLVLDLKSIIEKILKEDK